MGRKWWIVAGLVVAAMLWNSADAQEETEDAPVFTPPMQTQGTETAVTDTLEFPFVVRGTELIVQYAAQYEGPFLEDEIQEPVSGVMALMVYNPGTKYVKSARLIVQRGQEKLLFEITMLPPGSRVLVLEKNKSPYSEELPDDCHCFTLDMEQKMGATDIVVSEADGKLFAENQTGQPVSNVTLYYKQYSAEDGFYLGGYTCSKYIGSLMPEERIEVDLYRYVTGYSRIVAVTAEQ